METFERLSDVTQASNGLLDIQYNFDDGDVPLSEVRHLIYSPHGRPTMVNERDLMVDPEAVPEGFPNFKNLLRTELGLPIVAYSFYRADGGANEMGREIGDQLAQRGEKAIIVSPKNIIGRGVLDLNRPKEKSVGDSLFPMPELVAKDLHDIHDISNRVIFGLFKTLAAYNLKSVIQPHTMASGDPMDEEIQELGALAKEVANSLNPGDAAFGNPEKVIALLAKWDTVYNNMNSRRDRVGVDLVNGFHGNPQSRNEWKRVPDAGLSHRISDNFNSRNIPNFDNTPFGHIGGYPGSELAIDAGDRGLQQACIDVPRHLLMKDQNAEYRPLTFQPDRESVRLIAEAVVEAIEMV